LLSSFIHKGGEGGAFFHARLNNSIVIEEEAALNAIFACYRPILAVKMQLNLTFKRGSLTGGSLDMGRERDLSELTGSDSY
jgi:hypothetical protein